MRLGAIADDVTGACDLAGRAAEAGLPATVLLGVPDAGSPVDAFADGAGCTVVALIARTAPVERAVAEASAAARALLAAGATQLYQKYCSTFDSTPRGNIGPIADALVAVAGASGTIGTPSTPGSARTQYAGTLFAGGIPLAESPMRDHPLTPMRDSDVVRLLRPQTPKPVSLVRWEDVRLGPDRIAALSREGHTLVDALLERDLDAIAAAILRSALERPVVASGGAGVGTALARSAASERGDAGAPADPPHTATTATTVPAVPVTGRLILAGSASAATRAQIEAFGGDVHILDPFDLADDPDSELLRLREALARRTEPLAPVLVAASRDVARAQRELGAARAAGLIETALAELAAIAVHDLGFSHLLVAGGETSGAVTSRLGARRLLIGRQAAPGVPWAVALAGGRDVALLLKSGNFGGADLFTTAWEAAPCAP
ncbi:3-oxo-tetronate kinase [Leifsonia sp. NPDC080035]|uniref:3-oxo-tetronate kinase n=1 Tax=Leifsonia sp. NPDC080035 TaxID=3143936 RepID=A0AAU7GGV3_9MICO